MKRKSKSERGKANALKRERQCSRDSLQRLVRCLTKDGLQKEIPNQVLAIQRHLAVLNMVHGYEMIHETFRFPAITVKVNEFPYTGLDYVAQLNARVQTTSNEKLTHSGPIGGGNGLKTKLEEKDEKGQDE